MRKLLFTCIAIGLVVSLNARSFADGSGKAGPTSCVLTPSTCAYSTDWDGGSNGGNAADWADPKAGTKDYNIGSKSCGTYTDMNNEAAACGSKALGDKTKE